MRAEPPIPFKHRMASRIFGSILFEAMRHLLAQTDARCPASEVVGHHLDRQPGGVGGEAARGEMVESVFRLGEVNWPKAGCQTLARVAVVMSYRGSGYRN